MGRLVRYLGGMGFIFSAATNLLVLGGITALYALFTYPVSILFRGISWIKLDGEAHEGYYRITGVVTLILGAIVFLIFLPQSNILDVWGTSGALSNLAIPIILWAVYSLFELKAYHSLRIYTKMFAIAQISIVGIIAILIVAFGIPGSNTEMLRYGVLPLLVSSVTAASGFFKLKLGEE